jgi:adenylate kinase family enzyme
MKQVCVIGNSGSGKSVFSKKLANISKLPLIHLDKYYWTDTCTRPHESDWQQEVSEIVKADSWIIDGHHETTLVERFEKADTIIFLDYSVWLSLYRALKRHITKNKVDPSCLTKMPFKPKFFWYIWTFKLWNRKKVYAALEETKDYSYNFVHLKNDVEASEYLKNIKQ